MLPPGEDESLVGKRVTSAGRTLRVAVGAAGLAAMAASVALALALRPLPAPSQSPRLAGAPVSATPLPSAGPSVAASSSVPVPDSCGSAGCYPLFTDHDQAIAAESALARSVALADPRVAQLIAGQRWVELASWVVNLAPTKGDSTGRRFVSWGLVLYAPNETSEWDAMVDVVERRVVSFKRTTGISELMPSEVEAAFAIAETDPRVASLIRTLGVRRLDARVSRQLDDTTYWKLPTPIPSLCDRAGQRCAVVTFSSPDSTWVVDHFTGSYFWIEVSLTAGQVVQISAVRS